MPLRTVRCRLLLLCFLLYGEGTHGSHISVTWNDNSANETSFQIERATDDLVFHQIATVGANVSSYTDTTVVPSTTYHYRVRASNALGHSAYSNILSSTAPTVANTPPTVSAIHDVSIGQPNSRRVLSFRVNDAETPNHNLVVTARSSNPKLVPPSSLIHGGDGPDRTLTIVPASDQTGLSTITVMVNDGLMTTDKSFLLTVGSVASTPSLSVIPDQTASTGRTVGPIAFVATGESVSGDAFELVASSSNTQLLPDTNIILEGTGLNRSVTLLPADGQNGSTTITLSLRTGDTITHSSFMLTVNPATTRTFTNTNSIAITGATSAHPYPATIDVFGLDGVVTDVTVKLNDYIHAWGGDVDILLVSPSGQKVLLMSDAGTGPTSDANLTLSDFATALMPEQGPLSTGTYRPTNHDSLSDTFPTPAPPPPYSTRLATLNGSPAAGRWLLYVRDDMPGDVGYIRGGWSLTITTSPSGTLTAPVISDIDDQVTLVGTSTPLLPFTVDDRDTPVTSLTLSATSSNTTLIPPENIELSGSGSLRNVRLTPITGQAGTSTITIWVSDGVLTATRSFSLRVVPSSATPGVISTITSPLSATAETGIEFSYAITASNNPSAFDALNLPIGLFVNTSTGLISGTPTRSGTYEVTLVAVNNSNVQKEVLALHIAPPTSPLKQSLTVVPLPAAPVVGRPITLQTEATSELPVVYSVVNGNATVAGSLVTLHDTNPVTIKAMQGGSSAFEAVSAEYTLPRAFPPSLPLIYTGTIASDPLVATIDLQHTSGILYTALSSTGEALILPFTVEPDGKFAVTGQGRSAGTTPGTTHTLQGQLSYGDLRGSITNLGMTFAATLQPSTGQTKSVTGAYSGDTLSSAFGKTYLLATTQGQAYVISVASNGVTAGMGTISPDGTFEVRTPQSVIFEGIVNPSSKSLRGSIHSLGASHTNDFLGLAIDVPRTNRLGNISSLIRFSDQRPDSPPSSGIAVGGTGQQRLLLRTIGPTLADFGVFDSLRDPRLQLYDSVGSIIAQNDNWRTALQTVEIQSRVGAFPLLSGSLDSALVTSVPPGPYTLQVSSGGGSGVALLEIYDAGEPGQQTSIVNLSTQGYVDQEAGGLTGGFVVSGNAPCRVLVRGIGPSLEAFGVRDAVRNPTLEIFEGTRLIAYNDNWENPSAVGESQITASSVALASAGMQVGAFPLRSGSADSALIITLAPGAYTAVMRTADGVPGVGLLEIYALPND